MNESLDYDADAYFMILFPDFSLDSKDFWIAVATVALKTSEYVKYANFFVAAIALIPNFFHLIVLTRKSMRTMPIHIFIFGIGLCDFTRIALFLVMNIPQLWTTYQNLENPDW